ncbi:MAG TPA: PaaI family thioesterase [Candidatus Cybelea sp.]|nr:PaaI family thioesterase [Candidatus Cybelea sp.]
MGEFTIEAARETMAARFAPWVRDLGLEFEHVAADKVTARLRHSPHLARHGGVISGQAIMAAADTLMVFAVAAQLGGFVDVATVNQSIGFFRGAPGDLICEVRVLKLGRTLAFGEAIFTAADRPGDPVAQAAMTYALSAPK